MSKDDLVDFLEAAYKCNGIQFTNATDMEARIYLKLKL